MVWVCGAATPKYLRRQRVLLDLVLSSPERVFERSHCGICGTQQHPPGRDLGVAAACVVASPQPCGAGAWGEEREDVCVGVGGPWTAVSGPLVRRSPPGLAAPAPPPPSKTPWVGNLQTWGAAHHRAGVLQGCKTQGKKNSPDSVSRVHLWSLHPLRHPFSSRLSCCPKALALSGLPVCHWRKSSSEPGWGRGPFAQGQEAGETALGGHQPWTTSWSGCASCPSDRSQEAAKFEV